MTPVTFPPETCAALADIEDGTTVWVRVQAESLPENMAKNEEHHNCSECGGFCALYQAMWSKACPKCNGSGVVPPADLVALLDAKCKLCRGTRKVYPEHARGGSVALDTIPGYDPRISCLDCVDGSALFTIQGECSHTDEAHSDPEGPECTTGPLPGRWKLNSLVPVYLDTDDRAFRPDHPCVIIGTLHLRAEGVVATWSGDGDIAGISIAGPAPVPGDWVAQLTKATP